jgi:hypothetical protein
MQLFLQMLNDKRAFAKSGQGLCCAIITGWDFEIEKVFSPWDRLWLG